MNIVSRIIQGGVIAGFLISSSGCVIAPDRGGDRDRVVREPDRDRHDHDDRRCDDHDEHCRDR